jgi:hypothetical protein
LGRTRGNLNTIFDELKEAAGGISRVIRLFYPAFDPHHISFDGYLSSRYSSCVLFGCRRIPSFFLHNLSLSSNFLENGSSTSHEVHFEQGLGLLRQSNVPTGIVVERESFDPLDPKHQPLFPCVSSELQLPVTLWDQIEQTSLPRKALQLEAYEALLLAPPGSFHPM